MQILLFLIAIGLLAIVGFILIRTKPNSKNQTTVDGESAGINPTLDSDKDRISDSEEINRYGSDPYSYDTDRDGVGDRQEILQRTDPNSPDSDRDGLTDYEEQQLGTDPAHYDTDRDGVSDRTDRD